MNAGQRRSKRPRSIGDLTANIVAELALKRSVQELHSRGPRPFYELLREIGAHSDCRAFIERRAKRYAVISNSDLDKLSARDFSPPLLHGVTP